MLNSEVLYVARIDATRNRPRQICRLTDEILAAVVKFIVDRQMQSQEILGVFWVSLDIFHNSMHNIFEEPKKIDLIYIHSIVYFLSRLLLH